MRLKSHIHIANITCEMIEELAEVKINRFYLRLGAIMPDILPNRRYQLHSPHKVYFHYHKELHRILNKNKRSKRISFIIGLLTHYITDAFCLSHNIYVANLKKHVQYEYLLDNIKHDYQVSEDIIIKIKEYIEYLKEDSITIEKYVKQMNKKYLETINKDDWRSNIHNDIESAIIHVSTILSNFIMELKENKIAAFAV